VGAIRYERTGFSGESRLSREESPEQRTDKITLAGFIQVFFNFRAVCQTNVASRNRALILSVELGHDSRRAKSVRDYPFWAVLLFVVVYRTVFDIFKFHNQEKYALCGATCQQEKK